MIISVKNKQLTTFVDDSHNQLSNTIELSNTSINFANNLTFISLHNDSHTITNFNVTINGVMSIAYRNGLNTDYIETNTVGDSEIKVSDSGNKQIRKWNVYLLTDIEDTYTSKMTVSYTLNGTSFSYDFTIKCMVTGIDSKLIILAQNFKFDITNDYYLAFKESEHKSSGIDERLMNEKRKEFLLNYFDLQAQVGSYHTLISALHYFGYGDLLRISELWLNEDGLRASTNITTQVLDHIDNRLLGFKKTNQLQLIYKINDVDGTQDTDGLDNYENVLFDTEELLIKMYALKRVLEKDFLPLNTKIVDIIGEHTSVVGIDTNIWLNDQRIDEVDLNNQKDSIFSFNLNQTNIQYTEHQVLLKNIYFNADIPDYISNSRYLYFEIDKELIYDLNSTDSLDDIFNDDDYIQRYDRSDFGLVKLNINIDSTLYNRYKYEIYDLSISETTPQYVTDLQNISSLDIMFGVRKLGTFKVVLYLFDYYGGVSIINNNNQTFSIVNSNVDFRLAKINRTEINSFDKGLELFSTFETLKTTNRIVEIDCFDDTLDINTFDESTHTNTILRYQTKKYDARTLQLNNFQFNNVKLTELNNSRISDYGYEYAKILVDLIGDGTNGMRTIKMKLFNHYDWDIVELLYDNSYNDYDFYNEFITLINNKINSVWNRYTVQLQYFSNDIILNKRPILRIVAKEIGESVSNSYIDTSDIDIYTPIVNDISDYFTVMPLSGYMMISPNLSEYNDDLIINGVVISNILINSVNLLYTTIKTYFIDNSINASVFEYDDYIIISTRVLLNIQHVSFGKFIEVPRGSESSKLKIVPSGDTFYKGEPFYSYIDLNTKIDNIDCLWTLKNALTNEIIDQQNTYVYRNMLFNSGSYSLTLQTTDEFGTNTKTKEGFVVVE